MSKKKKQPQKPAARSAKTERKGGISMPVVAIVIVLIMLPAGT